MRFGKRLAEIIQSGRAHEPYISYKDLKHTIKKLCALIEGGSCSGDSSGDEPAAEEHAAGDPKDPNAVVAGQERSSIDAYQQEFFRLIDINIIQAKTYIDSSVHTLEAVIGEWQTFAVRAGLLYTPHQLTDIGSELGVQSPSHQVLVEWLRKLKTRECSPEARERLITNYNLVAAKLNELQQYIDVNLTALRKIFKKFEKKVPQKHRTKNVSQEYQKRQGLRSPAFQQLSYSSLQMERLMVDFCAGASGGPCVGQLVPLSHNGASSFESALPTNGMSASRIDVYAKPNLIADGAFLGGGAAAASSSAGPLVVSAAAPPPGVLPGRVTGGLVSAGPVAVGFQSGGSAEVPPGASAPATVHRFPSVLGGGAKEQPQGKANGKGVGPTAAGAVPTPKSKAGPGRPGGGGCQQEGAGGAAGAARPGRKRGGRGGRGGRQSAEPIHNDAQPAHAPAYMQKAPSEVAALSMPFSSAMVSHPGVGPAGNVGYPMGMQQGSGCAVNWLAMMPVAQWSPAMMPVMHHPEGGYAQHALVQLAPERRSADD